MVLVYIPLSNYHNAKDKGITKMKFIIEEDFWELFPQTAIGIVIAREIDNNKAQDEAVAILAQAVSAAGARLQSAGEDMAVYPAVAPWREAYKEFGVKPNKYRSSIENLLRSARNGNVRSISPLVDLYNAVSLQNELPCGGEDLQTVVGAIKLTRARGDELFVPLGSPEAQPPQPGEVIYKDDKGVLCRAWNWREAERTKLTTATTDAFLCIEAIPPFTERALSDACRDLAQLVINHLGATCQIEILSRSRPQIEF